MAVDPEMVVGTEDRAQALEMDEVVLEELEEPGEDPVFPLRYL